jgi:hypothetical protein
MNSPSPSTAPPAYEQQNTSRKFLIRNAQYRSFFTTDRQPNVQDYRNHFECMKDLFDQFSENGGSPSSPVDVPHILDLQYSQAFSEVAQLICEYQACLLKIKPMQEQDILYLLLDRFAQSTGVGVYLEIRTPKEVQIYDSEIPEPQVSQISSLPLSSANEEKHTAMMQEHITHGIGALNAEVSTDSPYDLPLNGSIVGAVTVNFPNMSLFNPIDSPPTYSLSIRSPLPEVNILTPIHDQEVLPGKLQPPTFRVHRCHHPGVERGSENNEFELPFGFPEVVQHVQDTPEYVGHSSTC